MGSSGSAGRRPLGRPPLHGRCAAGWSRGCCRRFGTEPLGLGRVNRDPCGEEAAQGRLSEVQKPPARVNNPGSGGEELSEEGF